MLWVPDVPFEPPHAPVATQSIAFCAVHDKVAEPLYAMLVGLAVNVALGAT